MATRLNTQIHEEAAEWLVEFRSGDIDPSARQQFTNWLRKSPEHVRAYLETAAIWNEGPGLDAALRYDIETLARDAKVGDNVVLLGGEGGRDDAKAFLPAKRNKANPISRYTLAAASLIALISVSTWLYTQRGTYTTDIGEQRSVRLDDGSVVELNSKSMVRIRYDDHQRDVELLRGQALFHVAKDKTRPFIVQTERTHVRAIGTEFDVYRRSAGTVVTVVEGRVAVLPSRGGAAAGQEGESASAAGDSATPSEILLAAGEQVTISAARERAQAREIQQRKSRALVANVTAWTQRRIVLESATLHEVAEEFNRYNTRQLIVRHGTPDDFHISGVFSSTDPDSIITFLRDRPGLAVVETAAAIYVSKK